ncbi:MAG TPA: LysM peptidoglycan-binding domain-containing protein, partial [Chitinophagaceae bacterium]
KDWALGLKKAGYATSKVYAERLIKTIEDYSLQQYSLEALGMRSPEKGNAFSAMLNKVVKKEEDDYNSTHPKQVKAAVTPAPSAAPAYPAGIFRINDKKVVYALKGSSLMEAAETHRLKLRRLLKYNELQNDGPLADDRLLYLEKKGKTGAHEVHIVQAGEDMYIISQKEGIRLKWLYKRNRMKRGEEPATGERLFLQGRAAHLPRLSGEPGKATSSFLINKDTSAPKRQWPAVSLDKKPPVSADKAAVPDNTGKTDKTADYTGPKVTYHVVEPKETLYGLSKKFKVSIAQLQQWNGLSGTDIKIGQKLIVNK